MLRRSSPAVVLFCLVACTVREKTSPSPDPCGDADSVPFAPNEVVATVDAEVPAVVFQDPILVTEWATAYLAQNVHRAGRLRAAGAPLPLPPGTTVEVARANSATAYVRVVSGPDEGRTGYVMSMCVGYHERARGADGRRAATSAEDRRQ